MYRVHLVLRVLVDLIQIMVGYMVVLNQVIIHHTKKNILYLMMVLVQVVLMNHYKKQEHHRHIPYYIQVML